MILFEIYTTFQRWKNCESRLRLDEVAVIDLGDAFLCDAV